MAIQYFDGNVDAFPSTAFESPERHAVASGGRESTTARLREFLARESVLRREMDRLIRRHREVLNKLFAGREDAANRIASLTARQRQIMELVLAGHPSKNIAADLGISRRTVESHRASIMKKTGSKSLPALGRFAFGTASTGADARRVQAGAPATAPGG